LDKGRRRNRSKELAKEVVEAPITGTIISIEVKVGDKVEEGDVLLYIESMKMENPIMAPIAGKVTEIKVAVKQVVETGKPMVTVEG
jgi:biotin carboxyl carrier protein